MEKIRKIIHIDMDAFYASVEQRDRPELKGKPVIVGGDPRSRGVVATCSYEARKYGIHSAMASSRAYRLCPHAVFLRPAFDKYKKVSSQIMNLFGEYTNLVEPLSLDEAFLDVTENRQGVITSATWKAMAITKEIYSRTGLTASAGVSYNKFLAKVASDCNKPAGITVVPPEHAADFIDRLEIRRFFGVGRVTEKKMHSLGVATGADLKKLDQKTLVTNFGKAGRYFYHIVRGEDYRPVCASRTRKSIGKEVTLSEDIDDKGRMIQIMNELACKVENSLQQHDTKGMTLTLKVKYSDFQTVTRSVTPGYPIYDAATMTAETKKLIEQTEAGRKKVRLLGVTVSNFIGCENNTDNKESRGYIQLPLPFEDNMTCEDVV